MLDHEAPLEGYARRIGGSSGKRTHGRSVSKPVDMPDRSKADHHVTNQRELHKALKDDNAIVYIANDIEITHADTVWIGDGVTVVSDYCAPDVPGQGPVIRHTGTDDGSYTRKCFAHTGGKPVRLYGVAAIGPRREYFDPDHTSELFADLTCSFLHEYAPKNAGTFRAVGCRFAGWTLAGLELGARTARTQSEIRRCTGDRNRMEHLGYAVELYNGFLSVRESFFDANRHAIAGFGHPNCGYAIADSVFGPTTVSHVLDMHALENSLTDGDDTAGEFVRVYRSSFMPTIDTLGRDQEALAIRGTPVNEDPGSYVDKCHFWHSSPPEPPGEQGSAYRQETQDWVNFEPRDNHFGEQIRDGYGAPRASNAPAQDDSKPQQPTPKSRQLSVHGESGEGTYRIVVSGDVRPTETVDDADQITALDGDRTELSGSLYGGIDTYELGQGARPVYAELHTRARIVLDGADITAELIAPGFARRLESQRSQIDRLETWASSLAERLSFGDSS